MDEALARSGADEGMAAWVRYQRGDAPADFSDRDPTAIRFAQMAGGDLASASAALNSDEVLRTPLMAGAALARWPAEGDRALDDLAEVAADTQAPDGIFAVTLLPSFLKATASGAWADFDAACAVSARERLIAQQRPWHDGSYLLGRIDETAFLAQPCSMPLTLHPATPA